MSVQIQSPCHQCGMHCDTAFVSAESWCWEDAEAAVNCIDAAKLLRSESLSLGEH